MCVDACQHRVAIAIDVGRHLSHVTAADNAADNGTDDAHDAHNAHKPDDPIHSRPVTVAIPQRR